MAFMVAAALVATLSAVAAWMVPMRIGATGAMALNALTEELAAVQEDRERMVLANETLGDLEHALRPDLKRPVKLAWIAFLSCLALAIAAHGTRDWRALAICLAFGALGPMSCLWAKRATSTAAAEARDLIDGRVEETLGELYHAEIVLPKRREMRWKRGKRKR